MYVISASHMRRDYSPIITDYFWHRMAINTPDNQRTIKINTISNKSSFTAELRITSYTNKHICSIILISIILYKTLCGFVILPRRYVYRQLPVCVRMCTCIYFVVHVYEYILWHVYILCSMFVFCRMCNYCIICVYILMLYMYMCIVCSTLMCVYIV